MRHVAKDGGAATQPPRTPTRRAIVPRIATPSRQPELFERADIMELLSKYGGPPRADGDGVPENGIGRHASKFAQPKDLFTGTLPGEVPGKPTRRYDNVVAWSTLIDQAQLGNMITQSKAAREHGLRKWVTDALAERRK
jgi:hypothetical protein